MAAPTGLAHPVGRLVGQSSRQLLPSALDGFLVQPRDLGQQAVTAGASLLGFQGRKPTALGFIQASKDQQQALVELPFGTLARLQTGPQAGATPPSP